ncbi:MAG: hypothetical protein CL885_00725 [Dehalococcoidia bacterium]|jgi:hypothetical protein|nr:hypothetical protein [Dehalococcoidia bacterium]MCH2531399.1 hypothetical protein [Dehalococcoidia bacterium]HCH35845.1 hypothetical protein [Dehalococcoidia bacterium]|tara:strand:+ start:7037 stop:8005 length:969 start_codon:yes stop_codon:yes gene_type:complete
MIFLEAGNNLHLRPAHLLLMIYRYASGIYQTGEISALSYTKGYLDHQGASNSPCRVLTVSSHGIGEAETWMVERLEDAIVETVSFKLINTQLFQFLRHADNEDIAEIINNFCEIVAPYRILSNLANDPGLVAYWQLQASKIKEIYGEKQLTVYSNTPDKIPFSRSYDVIYVTHSEPILPKGTVEYLRSLLAVEGLMAILVPDRSKSSNASEPFAISTPVKAAISDLRATHEQYGYHHVYQRSGDEKQLSKGAFRAESISFVVPSSTRVALIGELLLESLYDHIPDNVRLAALEHTASQLENEDAIVTERLKLFFHGNAEVWS